MADETEYALRLTATQRETGDCALKAINPLPWRFAQLAKDFDRRCFHEVYQRQEAKRFSVALARKCT